MQVAMSPLTCSASYMLDLALDTGTRIYTESRTNQYRYCRRKPARGKATANCDCARPLGQNTTQLHNAARPSACIHDWLKQANDTRVGSTTVSWVVVWKRRQPLARGVINPLRRPWIRSSGADGMECRYANDVGKKRGCVIQLTAKSCTQHSCVESLRSGP